MSIFFKAVTNSLSNTSRLPVISLEIESFILVIITHLYIMNSVLFSILRCLKTKSGKIHINRSLFISGGSTKQ